MASDNPDEFEALLERSSLGTAMASLEQDVPAALVERAMQRADQVDGPRYAVGLELQPYMIVGTVTDDQGHRLADGHLRLSKMTVSYVVHNAAKLISDLLHMAAIPAEGERVAAGLQLGGPVDTQTGTVLFYHKSSDGPQVPRHGFKWQNAPLASLLEQAIGLPVIIENDANAFAVYHQWFGAGRGVSRFAVILIRQGVGGGVILDDELLDVPAEIGQLVTEDCGERCDCGRRGCLESAAGIRGILRRIKDHTGHQLDGIVAAAELGSGEDGDAAEKACESFSAAGKTIARAIGHMVNMYNPKRLILCAPAVMVETGSPPSAAFLARATKTRSATHPAFRRHEVVVRPIGPFDGAHGAALITLTRCFGIRPVIVASRTGPHK